MDGWYVGGLDKTASQAHTPPGPPLKGDNSLGETRYTPTSLLFPQISGRAVIGTYIAKEGKRETNWSGTQVASESSRQ